MCLAIVAHIKSISGSKAKADYNGNMVEAELGLVEAQEGDYILIHAGCAIEVLSKENAEVTLALLKELEEVMNE